MKSFLLALQFLTIIPVKVKKPISSGSSVYFPLVGLFLGLILLSSHNFLLLLKLEQLSVNIMLVVLLTILTGGIHLDGLADTIDAFSSRKNKEEMLKIMRDSHIGTMGVLALISVILLKIAFLTPGALVLMCILSRWALVLSMFLFPYAREEGKAKMLVQGTNLKVFIFSTILTLMCVAWFGRTQGFLVMAIIAMLTYMIGSLMKNKIGGITGDTLGATNELIEVVTLFILCIM